MTTRPWRLLALFSIALTLCAARSASAGVDWIGPNLLSNPDFEIDGDRGLPRDWTLTATPAGAVHFSLDRRVFLVGKTSLKAEVPNTGGATVRSKPVPIEQGKWYLVSVGYRTEGFGERGTYSGVDSYVAVTWNDAGGRQIALSPGISFPYHAVDWDLGDRFVLAPAGAAQMVLAASLQNHSRQQTGKNIPSTLWLDGWQVRRYDPPPTPAWALQKVPRIVEGGLSTSRARPINSPARTWPGASGAPSWQIPRPPTIRSSAVPRAWAGASWPIPLTSPTHLPASIAPCCERR